MRRLSWWRGLALSLLTLAVAGCRGPVIAPAPAPSHPFVLRADGGDGIGVELRGFAEGHQAGRSASFDLRLRNAQQVDWPARYCLALLTTEGIVATLADEPFTVAPGAERVVSLTVGLPAGLPGGAYGLALVIPDRLAAVATIYLGDEPSGLSSAGPWPDPVCHAASATALPPPQATPAVPTEGPIEIPAAGARVTLPVHLLARSGQPSETVVAIVRWQDGTELANHFVVRRGVNGQGVVIDSLDWVYPGQRTPQPSTQPATVEIRDVTGTVRARQAITVLHESDPDVRVITLYWLKGDTLQPEQRAIPRTEAVATAALQELLWGPPPGRPAGYSTAIPTPEQVLAYPGREPDWGPQVTLRGLSIIDGVATADFSRELRAYGGGSARVAQIRQQVERTLLQVPTVQTVRIAIECETAGVLEP